MYRRIAMKHTIPVSTSPTTTKTTQLFSRNFESAMKVMYQMNGNFQEIVTLSQKTINIDLCLTNASTIISGSDAEELTVNISKLILPITKNIVNGQWDHLINTSPNNITKTRFLLAAFVIRGLFNQLQEAKNKELVHKLVRSTTPLIDHEYAKGVTETFNTHLEALETDNTIRVILRTILRISAIKETEYFPGTPFTTLTEPTVNWGPDFGTPPGLSSIALRAEEPAFQMAPAPKKVKSKKAPKRHAAPTHHPYRRTSANHRTAQQDRRFDMQSETKARLREIFSEKELAQMRMLFMTH